MKQFLNMILGSLLIATPWGSIQAHEKTIDPISWKIISSNLPSHSLIGEEYTTIYQFQSNLAFPMPTPLRIIKDSSTPEFSIEDSCSGVQLAPGGTCQVKITHTIATPGKKSLLLMPQYGNTKLQLPQISTISSINWVGTIGVDYNPNHYPQGNIFNSHDVFYAGNNGSGSPATNVYMELAQLKAAGFTVVRSYQTIEYAWIDIIKQANQLGLFVVYEAVIPQNGSQTDINNAISVLNNVINTVGTTVFQNTVVLVFAGHENYSNTDINYLTNAVNSLQNTLISAGLSVPVGSALVSGDLVTPGSVADMTTLINSYSPQAPLGFDPYPFQWGVTPPDQAATNASLMNSIAWDYAQIITQSFYVSPRAILMAETGWATSGTGQFAQYYCYLNGNICAPSEANAALYLSALYGFVGNSANNSGALVFEAYDEPAKDSTNPTDAENFYGIFDTNCNLKNNDTTLLPNTSYVPGNNYGCQGFINGATFTVVGINPASQPTFTVAVSQTNPTTSQDASLTVTVPNENRSNQNVNPWPQYLAYNNAQITISGSLSGTTCNVTATVASQNLTFGAVSCSNPGYQVNCAGVVCFLPGNF